MSDEAEKAWQQREALFPDAPPDALPFIAADRAGFMGGWHARDAEVAELREAFFAKVNAMNAADWIINRKEHPRCSTRDWHQLLNARPFRETAGRCAAQTGAVDAQVAEPRARTDNEGELTWTFGRARRVLCAES